MEDGGWSVEIYNPDGMSINLAIYTSLMVYMK